MLRHLQDLELVGKAAGSRWRPRREPLPDRILAEYRGPGGSLQYFCGLDSSAGRGYPRGVPGLSGVQSHCLRRERTTTILTSCEL
jgi:hypothetical protein